MSKHRPLVIAIAAAAITAAVSQSAAAISMPTTQMSGLGRSHIELVDARSYNHCHNMPRRTRCHKKSRLPVNWPPNTSTPSTSKSKKS